MSLLNFISIRNQRQVSPHGHASRQFSPLSFHARKGRHNFKDGKTSMSDPQEDMHHFQSNAEKDLSQLRQFNTYAHRPRVVRENCWRQSCPPVLMEIKAVDSENCLTRSRDQVTAYPTQKLSETVRFLAKEMPNRCLDEEGFIQEFERELNRQEEAHRLKVQHWYWRIVRQIAPQFTLILSGPDNDASPLTSTCMCPVK